MLSPCLDSSTDYFPMYLRRIWPLLGSGQVTLEIMYPALSKVYENVIWPSRKTYSVKRVLCTMTSFWCSPGPCHALWDVVVVGGPPNLSFVPWHHVTGAPWPLPASPKSTVSRRQLKHDATIYLSARRCKVQGTSWNAPAGSQIGISDTVEQASGESLKTLPKYSQRKEWYDSYVVSIYT